MRPFDPAALDLDAYLAHIGYSGPLSASVPVLQELALAHPQAIPFENLSPLLRRPVPLDVPSLQQKMLREGRGGWCFEQNILFGSALAALGFPVTGLAARVLWNSPPGSVPARSHMVVHVVVDGRDYIADVGFGGLTLTAPLRLEAGVEQATPHETFRLVRVEADPSHPHSAPAFVLEVRLGDTWKAMYLFDLQPQLLADYDVTNWYLANSPKSFFTTTLVAARVAKDRRHALRNTELSTHYRDGYTERRLLLSSLEIRDALTQVFGVTVPEGPDADVVFDRVVASATSAVTRT